MCMRQDVRETSELKLRCMDTHEFYAFKVLRNCNRLTSPLYDISDNMWRPGVAHSNRTFVFPNSNDDIYVDSFYTEYWDIYRGIHVFSTSKEADYYRLGVAYGVVVPVLCHINDLVAVGQKGEQAVFTKVTLEQKYYDRVRRGESILCV